MSRPSDHPEDYRLVGPSEAWKNLQSDFRNYPVQSWGLVVFLVAASLVFSWGLYLQDNGMLFREQHPASHIVFPCGLNLVHPEEITEEMQLNPQPCLPAARSLSSESSPLPNEP